MDKKTQELLENFDKTKVRFFVGRLKDNNPDNTWWCHGLHEDEGVTFENYDTLDNIISELKILECKAMIGKEYSIHLLYANSSKEHSYTDYMNFLTPIKT